jgi:nucleoid DNA-binding protein|tara:strand:+ start:8023 stop:8277 length:255 start_codon:yes stop_codon:yes gene_type:complete
MGEKKSRLSQIIDEISHDLSVDKSTVRSVLTLLFKEIAITLILKGKPVLIRRFVKFVIALRGINKIRKDINNVNKEENELKRTD